MNERTNDPITKRPTAQPLHSCHITQLPTGRPTTSSEASLVFLVGLSGSLLVEAKEGRRAVSDGGIFVAAVQPHVATALLRHGASFLSVRPSQHPPLLDTYASLSPGTSLPTLRDTFVYRLVVHHTHYYQRGLLVH